MFRTPSPFLAGRGLKHLAVTAFEDIEEIKFPYTSSMPKSLTSAGRHPWQAPPSLPWGEGGMRVWVTPKCDVLDSKLVGV